MTIDRKHILKLASLANLTLSEEEIDDYISDTNKILSLSPMKSHKIVKDTVQEVLADDMIHTSTEIQQLLDGTMINLVYHNVLTKR